MAGLYFTHGYRSAFRLTQRSTVVFICEKRYYPIKRIVLARYSWLLWIFSCGELKADNVILVFSARSRINFGYCGCIRFWWCTLSYSDSYMFSSKIILTLWLVTHFDLAYLRLDLGFSNLPVPKIDAYASLYFKD